MAARSNIPTTIQINNNAIQISYTQEATAQNTNNQQSKQKTSKKRKTRIKMSINYSILLQKLLFIYALLFEKSIYLVAH